MLKMKFDEIDTSILFYLMTNNGQTTSDIAKKIFDCKTSHDAHDQDARIRYRVKKMEEMKIILCAPTVPRTYSINPEHVFCGQGSLHVKINGGKVIEVDFGEFLVVTDSTDYMQINRILKNGNEAKDVEIVA
jgi:hypothetical protein